ncbi:MAG TPA: hypothetical protein VFE91_07705 [Nitrososphaerales archaeon]|nr:hypothetical protein [Nitrososphaerales archaeon]
MPRVFGSTGQLHLGYVNSVPSPTSGTTGVGTTSLVNESVYAGSNAVAFAGYSNLTNAARVDLFALAFDSVTFSGTQFKLYISTNGFSQINTTAGETQDLQYGPTFSTSDFAQNPMKAVSSSLPGVGSVTYYIGTNGTHKLVVGPIPIQISNSYAYIKVYDGNSGAVAVSHETLVVLPGLAVSPSSGAAGTSAVFNGGGYPAGKVIDILYSYSTVNWEGATVVHGIKNLTTGISTGSGFFSSTGTIPDTAQAINPLVAGVQNNVQITFYAKLEPTPHSLFATTVFNEGPRFISEVISLDNTGACVSNDQDPSDCSTPAFSSTTFWGNDTGTTGAAVVNGVTGTVSDLPQMNAYSLGSLIIAGNNSFASGTVTFWVGTTQIGSTTSGTDGTFNGTATLPALPNGLATISVQSNSVTYTFQINVLPTLILTPSSGPIGTTVTATAYGFPSNHWVSLWWNEHSLGDGNDYYLINGTVGSNGQFNVTMTFVVPHSYGGAHSIDATYTVIHTATGYVPQDTITLSGGFVTSGTFTVTPTLVLCNGSTNACGAGDTSADTISINANSRVILSAQGTGLVAANNGCFDKYYSVVVDNAQMWGKYVYSGAASNGDWMFNFTGAGFRPGLHQVEIFDNECYNPAPAAVAYFNVTTTGDYVAGPVVTAVSSLQASITSLQSSLTGIQSSLTTITNDVSGLGTQISGLSTQLTAIQTSVGSISGLQSSITSLSSKLDSVTSTLSSVTSSLTSIQNAVQSAATNAQTAATNAQSAATAANNASSGTSTAQTYVLVVAVLAAITLVLELAILVRKLS